MPLNNDVYPYSVTGARCARWNAQTQLYNSSVAIPNLQSISLDPNMVTDMRKAYGKTVGKIAIMEDVEVGLNFTGIHYPSAAEMTGKSVTDSGSGLRYSDAPGGGAGLAYFGFNCSIPADDESEMHLILPYLKLDDDIFGLAFEQNKFATKEAKATGMTLQLATGANLLVYRWYHRESAVALETNFNLWKILLGI